MKLHLTSAQLRGLVTDGVPFDPQYPFEESGRDDGCLHSPIDGMHDSFSICVPIREFLSARFGSPMESITLHWSDYYWTYSADLEGVDLTPAELQKIEEYDLPL